MHFVILKTCEKNYLESCLCFQHYENLTDSTVHYGKSKVGYKPLFRQQDGWSTVREFQYEETLQIDLYQRINNNFYCMDWKLLYHSDYCKMVMGHIVHIIHVKHVLVSFLLYLFYQLLVIHLMVKVDEIWKGSHIFRFWKWNHDGLETSNLIH